MPFVNIWKLESDEFAGANPSQIFKFNVYHPQRWLPAAPNLISVPSPDQVAKPERLAA